MDSGQPAAAINLATCSAGPFAAAFDLDRVLRIEAEEQAAPGAPVVDLARAWGVAQGGKQRVLALRSRGDVLRLRVGEPLRILTLPASSLGSVPAFLRGLASRAAIGGVLILEERILLLVDADQLAEAAAAPRQGEAP
jgi:hypothetical protein